MDPIGIVARGGPAYEYDRYIDGIDALLMDPRRAARFLGDNQSHSFRGLGAGRSCGVPQVFIQASTSSHGTPSRLCLNAARRRAASPTTSRAQGPGPELRMSSTAGRSTPSPPPR